MTSDKKPNADDTAPVATAAADEAPGQDAQSAAITFSIRSVAPAFDPAKAESPADVPRPTQSADAAGSPPGVIVHPKMTMMDMGVSAAVVGSLGKSRLPSTPSVETMPMSFEPFSSPSGVDHGAGRVPGQVPASEPTFAPSASASEPLALPQPSVDSEVDPIPLLPNQRRARLVIVVGAVIGAALLIGVIASLRGHRSSAPSEKESPVATATSTAVPAPASPPLAPEPVAPEAATTSAPTKPFNLFAARQALDATSRSVLACRKDKRWGVASATVTFANDGAVSGVVVGVPFAGTPTGACVAEELSAAHVPPFAGKPGALVYQFFVAPK